MCRCVCKCSGNILPKPIKLTKSVALLQFHETPSAQSLCRVIAYRPASSVQILYKTNIVKSHL